MLLAILDPEFLNQINGVWENIKETRKEHPEAFAISMWCFGFVLWGIVLYYRNSKQPIAWSEFGKPLYDALQNTKDWKWYTVNDIDAIFCDINNQMIDCRFDGNFTINRVVITEYLPKKEIKELTKLKNAIIALRKEEAKKEQEKLKELTKQKLLSELSLVSVPSKKPEPKELTIKEKVILKELLAPESWRWGKDDNGKPKEKFIRTNIGNVFYDIETETFYVDKIQKENIITPSGEVFYNLAESIVKSLKEKNPVSIHELQNLTTQEKIIFRSLNFQNSWRWFDNGQTKTKYIINSEYVIYDTESRTFYINNIEFGCKVPLTEQKAKIFNEMASNIVKNLPVPKT